jgi:hypothetical protein
MNNFLTVGGRWMNRGVGFYVVVDAAIAVNPIGILQIIFIKNNFINFNHLIILFKL